MSEFCHFCESIPYGLNPRVVLEQVLSSFYGIASGSWVSQYGLFPVTLFCKVFLAIDVTMIGPDVNVFLSGDSWI